MRAAIYARVSTEDQARHGYSLPDQIRECRRRATETGAHECVEFIDDGVSGGDLDRPALDRLRQETRNGAFDLVIALDPDRLSRTLVHLLLLTDEIEAHARLVFCSMAWERTPEGRLFLSLRGAVAEFEKAKIRERTIRGARQKALQGRIAHAPTNIYGYRYRDGELHVERDEAEAVRHMFELALDGVGTPTMARTMSAEGWPPPRSGSWWQPVVLGILRNPVYAGRLRQFWRGTSGSTIFVDVPPIIDPSTFAAVQEALDERRRSNPGRANATRRLLSGLGRCEICGARMVVSTNAKGAWYVCAGRRPRRKYLAGQETRIVKCENRYHRARELEAAVWAAVEELLGQPEEAWLELMGRAVGGDPDEVPRLRGEVDTLRAARDRVLRLVARGAVSEDDAERTLREDAERLRQLTQRLRALEAAKTEHRRGAASAVESVRALRALAESTDDPATRRTVVRRLVDHVVVGSDGGVRLVPRI